MYSGPSFETPAEINALKTIGGDAVGMSTLPEIIKGKELGLNILGVSCLTNYGSGLVDNILSHDEVLKVANNVQNKLSSLLINFIK